MKANPRTAWNTLKQIAAPSQTQHSCDSLSLSKLSSPLETFSARFFKGSSQHFKSYLLFDQNKTMAAVCWGNLYIFVSLKFKIMCFFLRDQWRLDSFTSKQSAPKRREDQHRKATKQSSKIIQAWKQTWMTLPFWKVEPTRTWDDFDVLWGLVTTKRFQKSSGVIAFHSPNHQEQRQPGQLLEVPTPVPARGPARHTQLLGGLLGGWNKNAILYNYTYNS